MLVKLYKHLYDIEHFNEYDNVYAIFVSVKDENTVKYKYIYGHYYNKFNDFLYKNIRNDEIVDHEIFKCTCSDLLYNSRHTVIYSNSYEELKTLISNYIEFNSGQLPITIAFTSGDIIKVAETNIEDSFTI